LVKLEKKLLRIQKKSSKAKLQVSVVDAEVSDGATNGVEVKG